ncbi:DUF4142 domain-containing protein [Mucilaginibacter achroorhodeus]|uniref:DUF4142 domain-containing protein n=1 Tax=Mucilaginibacter achroorhodeus TaxID=2599294 RepID=A0A563U3P4_9SPHI|nr:DUF4142 domain-containing protein [Mucilaginibacter achroorhodeus]TWR25977.1 DUF4142 domain-containing protein [Mucilaginibacter achroorhodeus]
MRRLGAVLVLVTIIQILACNERKGKNYNKEAINDNERVFMQTAHEDGLAEIAISQLALKKTKDTSLVSLAKHIIADHTDADAQLKKMAKADKITLSDTLSSIHNDAVKSLSAKKGKAFDKAYAQVIVNYNEKAIKLFKAAAETTDGDVQDLAKQTLPKLQSHFQKAENICTDLK